MTTEKELKEGKGDCFVVAYEQAMMHNYKVVHALATGRGPIEGIVYSHAFNLVENGEFGIDWVIDKSNDIDIKVPAAAYFAIGRIKRSKIYTKRQAMRLALETGNYGPWDPKLLKNPN